MSMRNLRKNIRNGQMRAAALLPAWCLAMGALTAGTAHADGVAPLPLTFQIQDRPIQKVPTTFKFQARVSQGKIPTGDGVFDLNVHLKSAGKDVCSESLKQVRVVDSVLNVELGRSMNCQLDEVMASYADLSFQICIQNDENCLKPIAMSTVPYAVKASYAAQAQVAHQSDIAAQCNYAHRVSADDDLALLKDIGAGYYDFHTPTGTDPIVIDGQSVQGGFIQWTPVNSTNKLNVCAKTAATGQLQKLAEFAVHADVARMVNQLQVGGVMHVAGDSTFDKKVDVAGAFHAADVATFDKKVTAANGLDLSGASTFAQGATFTFNGDAIFTGKVTLPQGGIIAGNSVDSSAVVDGSLTGDDIKDGYLTTADLADGSVTNAKLQNTAVDSRVVLNESLTTDDIKNYTILGVDMAANSLNGGHIVDGTIYGADVAASTLTGSNIADYSIGGADVAGGAIASYQIADNSITTDDIQNYTIGNADINSNAVAGWQVVDDSIGPADTFFYPNFYWVNFPGGSGSYPMLNLSYPSTNLCLLTTVKQYQLGGTCSISRNSSNQWMMNVDRAYCDALCF